MEAGQGMVQTRDSVEMKYSIETIKSEISPETRQEMLASLQACKEVPDYMKTSGGRFEEVWVAGCWLNAKLRASGASEAQVKQIGFAHGQRSFFENPYKWAAIYHNEFIENQSIKDKPGLELADDINEQHIKIVDGGIVITGEDAK